MRQLGLLFPIYTYIYGKIKFMFPNHQPFSMFLGHVFLGPELSEPLGTLNLEARHHKTTQTAWQTAEDLQGEILCAHTVNICNMYDNMYIYIHKQR